MTRKELTKNGKPISMNYKKAQTSVCAFFASRQCFGMWITHGDTYMNREMIVDILNRFPGWDRDVREVKAFQTEEDGTDYAVWKVETPEEVFVLKRSTPREGEVYKTYFSNGGAVPKLHGILRVEEQTYLLMEYIEGQTLSKCTREALRATLDALIQMQDLHWNSDCKVGYGLEESYPNREKRLPYLEDLKPCYEAYLEAFKTLPQTLCNDDMLPFNVLVAGNRAVILDWEYGGILPYPCALARLLAFGEEEEDSLFYMTREDKSFALDYYYEKLIASKGISREAYDRTMKLFFFKEYSEWVYCANQSGDRSQIDYPKYYGLSRQIAQELGFFPACEDGENGVK